MILNASTDRARNDVSQKSWNGDTTDLRVVPEYILKYIAPMACGEPERAELVRHYKERMGMTDEPIEYSWHSTPALWCAVRRSYDGAPDAHCPIGFGRTKEEAAADLIEMEDNRA